LAVNLSAEPWTWPEEDLAKDVLEIITVFSARLDASRSRKNQPLLEEPNGEASFA
jgi:predicted site-specific integrase-resolvase